MMKTKHIHKNKNMQWEWKTKKKKGISPSYPYLDVSTTYLPKILPVSINS